VRFHGKNKIVYGVIEGEKIREIEGDIFDHFRLRNKNYSSKEILVLPPCIPSKIIAIGLNYRSHANEVRMQIPEEPMLFLKPASAVIGAEDRILFPTMAKRVDYEGELGIVVGKKCRGVSQQDAPHYILGYTCFNDVTARDLQKKDVQFTRSKSFDTFAPMGPCIETDLDPSDVLVETFLNGEKKQSASTKDLIFPVTFLVAFISNVMTLMPGDVIATGTPSGIGPMAVGDIIEVSIQGIGILRNKVARTT
jgi:2-keto-4-pentenoate hydratase/2-oxohepta-3-ene-1,7-dioic acid hydratase in catechol pathway